MVYYILKNSERMKRMKVTVTIDRPLGSVHPSHPDIVYMVNYGYVGGIIAPDGEEQDVYVLGVDQPVKTFTGRIIAVIHRNDDIEEKWVAAPDGVSLTPDQIMEKVSFVEKYFDSHVIMTEDALTSGNRAE